MRQLNIAVRACKLHMEEIHPFNGITSVPLVGFAGITPFISWEPLPILKPGDA